MPVYRVKRHKALAVRIAELTEELEKLRSEKALLLQRFEYAEDAGAETFRKDIATMETGLKKLEAREQKFSSELNKALAEYAELKERAADFDPMELYKARQAIRPTQEKAAERQLKDSNSMQEKPSLVMLLSAKQKASRLLGEDAEERQARQLIMHRNQESSIEIPSVNEKEMTLSGNHVVETVAHTSRRLYTWGMSSSVVQIVLQEDYCRYCRSCCVNSCSSPCDQPICAI